MITFIEHPVFTRQICELLTDEEYRKFQAELSQKPTTGDVIPGLCGLRKERIALTGRGKRGEARVIYILLLNVNVVYFFYAYSKGDMPDLTPEQLKRLRNAVMMIKQEYLK